LPGAQENEKNGVDVVSHQYGVLEELEIAHIYIAQLNDVVKELRAEVAELKAQQLAVNAKLGAGLQGMAAQGIHTGATAVRLESDLVSLE
jgi:hypothetical protein